MVHARHANRRPWYPRHRSKILFANESVKSTPLICCCAALAYGALQYENQQILGIATIVWQRLPAMIMVRISPILLQLLDLNCF